MPLLYLTLAFFLYPILTPANEMRPIVLVSLAPYRHFVTEIAHDRVEVDLMVPPGGSAHTYEPTPKQMARAARADAWFFLGEPFEKKALLALQHVKPNLKTVDLRHNIPLIHEQQCHCVHCGADLHIWLSPKMAQIQAKTIAQGLAELYPADKDFFFTNLQKLLLSLEALDQFITSTLAPVKERIILVSHPAYAYFCRDYQFRQIPIEVEGRDPTQKQLLALIEKTHQYKIHFILTQPQYSDKPAQLLAKQIDAKVISVDPYSENYQEALAYIAKVIAEHQ